MLRNFLILWNSVWQTSGLWQPIKLYWIETIIIHWNWYLVLIGDKVTCNVQLYLYHNHSKIKWPLGWPRNDMKWHIVTFIGEISDIKYLSGILSGKLTSNIFTADVNNQTRKNAFYHAGSKTGQFWKTKNKNTGIRSSRTKRSDDG